MKSFQRILYPSLLLVGLVPLLSGCYTQLATSREDEDRPSRRSYRSSTPQYDDRAVTADDSTQVSDNRLATDDEWMRTHSLVGFRYYYPRYSSAYFSNSYDPYYDPWYYNYADCYYDPWICGTPYMGYGRPYWYNSYWAGMYGGYYSPYGYNRYPYYGGVTVVSNGTGRTRDSGTRRSGGSTRNRDNNGGYSIGTSGSGGAYTPPAGRSTGASQNGGQGVRSRSSSGDSRGASRGSSSPPSRSSSGSSGSSSSGRSSGESTRSSGSSRSRVELWPAGGYTPPAWSAPTRSYSPPPQGAPTSSSGSGESSRSSGATRSR